ncbi:DUF1317 family protein [Escherichia coli]|nr:DUF1317 family protein [Escherichia coli]EGL9804279.1 DUF1317 family protein [Escherichia coli]EHI0834892.1 DUF1317 family protein [Escherichia coli]EHJ5441203.1 DUF1317 family protein [Escherichia coli]EHK5976481.1 DUF1317 family protein [Escherichia coli]
MHCSAAFSTHGLILLYGGLGAITFIYSVTKRGWVFPGLSVIRNPLKAQRLAEEINNKRGAVCTKHLPLS